MKKSVIHESLNPFLCKGGLFDVESPLSEDIGLIGIYNGKDYGKYTGSLCPFTITGIQKIYDGSIAYRVVADFDISGIGRPEKPENVVFITEEERQHHRKIYAEKNREWHLQNGWTFDAKNKLWFVVDEDCTVIANLTDWEIELMNY